MIQVVYTPKWFYGKDIIIDVVSIFVLLLIGLFSLKYYRLERKNKNYLFLAVSFILIAASFFFKILTNFTVYFREFETKYFGTYVLKYNLVGTSDILFFGGYLANRLLALLGLYMLYSIYQKNQSRQTIFLIIFFIIISTYFSQSAYYLFHLTVLVILGLITLQFYGNYRKKRQSTTRLLAASFAIIGISQIFFMFAGYNEVLYVAAEVIQLIGYLILLTTFIKVLSNAKKKKQD